MAMSERTGPQFSSSLMEKVHPLVIFNICDFYVQRPDQTKRVLGTLLCSVLPDGTVDIRNSYVVPHSENLEQFMNTRQSQEKDFLFDSKIERTARHNRKETAQRLLTDSTSASPSTPPSSSGLGILLVPSPSPSIHSASDTEEEQEIHVNAKAEEQKSLKYSFVP